MNKKLLILIVVICFVVATFLVFNHHKKASYSITDTERTWVGDPSSINTTGGKGY